MSCIYILDSLKKTKKGVANKYGICDFLINICSSRLYKCAQIKYLSYTTARQIICFKTFQTSLLWTPISGL